MGQPAARTTDMHTCPMVNGVVPHVGGPVMPPCAPTVLIGKLPAARIGDICTCVGPPDVVVVGSAGVMIGGQPAARVGDQTAHGGVIVLGCPTVFIGDTGGASGAAGVSASTPPTLVPSTYGNAVSIDGDDVFRQKTLAALDQIKKTPTGAALLESLERSGRSVSIKPSQDGNGCGYTNPAARFAQADGTPGTGTNSTVVFDPDTRTIGSEAWETRPPAIGLAHELVHAEHAATGTMSTGEVQNDSKRDPTNPTRFQMYRKREIEAVGVPPNDQRAFTENKIRSEWDPPQPERKWY